MGATSRWACAPWRCSILGSILCLTFATQISATNLKGFRKDFSCFSYLGRFSYTANDMDGAYFYYNITVPFRNRATKLVIFHSEYDGWSEINEDSMDCASKFKRSQCVVGLSQAQIGHFEQTHEKYLTNPLKEDGSLADPDDHAWWEMIGQLKCAGQSQTGWTFVALINFDSDRCGTEGVLSEADMRHACQQRSDEESCNAEYFCQYTKTVAKTCAYKPANCPDHTKRECRFDARCDFVKSGDDSYCEEIKYETAMLCDGPVESVHYDVHMRNTNNVFPEYGADASHTAVFSITMFFFYVLLGLFVSSLTKELLAKDMLHHTVKIFIGSYMFAGAGMLCWVIENMQYSTTGRANKPAVLAAALCIIISDTLLLLLALLLAKGWTIVRWKITAMERVQIAVFTTMYFVLALLAVAWYDIEYTSKNSLMIWESGPGIALLVTRFVSYLWFLGVLIDVLRRFRSKKRFYLKFGTGFGLWIIAPVLFFAFSLTMYSWNRSEFMTFTTTLSTLIAHLLMAILYDPRMSDDSGFPFHTKARQQAKLTENSQQPLKAARQYAIALVARLKVTREVTTALVETIAKLATAVDAPEYDSAGTDTPAKTPHASPLASAGQSPGSPQDKMSVGRGTLGFADQETEAQAGGSGRTLASGVDRGETGSSDFETNLPTGGGTQDQYHSDRSDIGSDEGHTADCGPSTTMTMGGPSSKNQTGAEV